MAYTIKTKAAAMAALLTGDPPLDVAALYRVTVPTIYRWNAAVWAMVRASLTPDVRAELAELKRMWPGLVRHQNENGAWGWWDRAPRCNAKTRSGEPCFNPRVRGKPRCRMHGCGGVASVASVARGR